MLLKKKIGYWITAAFLILFGVLFIVLGTNYDQDVVNTLDIIIGVLFLIEGSAAILVSVLVKKQFVSPLSLSGAVSLALGIYCLVKSFINTFLTIFLDFVPYLLIVIASLMILQALLTFFLSKKKDLVLFIIQLVYGLIILTFGILGITVFKDRDTKFIILGTIICLYATYIVLGSFIPAILVLAVKNDVEENIQKDVEEVQVIDEE